MGSISSLAWGLMQYRSKMWRENWLLFGLKLERKLNYRGISTKIFGFEYEVRKKKKALEVFEGQIRKREQGFFESFGALRLAHIAMFIFSIIWFALFIGSLMLINF